MRALKLIHGDDAPVLTVRLREPRPRGIGFFGMLSLFILAVAVPVGDSMWARDQIAPYLAEVMVGPGPTAKSSQQHSPAHVASSVMDAPLSFQ